MKKSMFFVFAIAAVLALIAAGCASTGTQSQNDAQAQNKQNTQPAGGNINNAQAVPLEQGSPPSLPPSQGSSGGSEMRIRAFSWGFDPETITVNKGDAVHLLVSTSDVEHGFSIDEFGVHASIVPGKNVPVDFVADKAGTFIFYCSTFCGSGHSGMRGQLVVREP